MHVPSSFCALTVSIFDEHDYKLHCYSGENVIDEFYNCMNQEEKRIRSILDQNNAMIELTKDQNIRHEMTTVCDTCIKEFTPINPKTRHHCHVTGMYIGPVCQSCNLKLKCRTWNNEFFVPCFFHNSSAYDSHLIIKYLHKKKSKITVIPSNTEQFIGFQIDGIRYLDSYKFLSWSLTISLKIFITMESIVSNTRDTCSAMAIRTFSRRVYMTSRDIFKQTCLPCEPKEPKRCGISTNAKICKIFTMFTSSSMLFCWLIVWKISDVWVYKNMESIRLTVGR